LRQCAESLVKLALAKASRQGWTELAELVSRKSKGRISIEQRAMKERFKRYKSKYYATKAKSLGTGFGITSDDRRKGIYSIADKLDNLCPFFSKMDKLFGKKPNVVPLGEICINNTTYIHGVDGFCDASDDEYQSSEEDGGSDLGNDVVVGFDGDNDFEGFDEHAQPDIVENNSNADLGPEEIEEESNIDEVDKTIDTPIGQQVKKKHDRSSDDITSISKRTRVKDTRKAPPTLAPAPTSQTRNGFATAYAESAQAKLKCK
jgi:hypothetical protein